jgi:lipopolysaccharide transport system ATP-binding protein
MKPILKVENLGKLYQLGQSATVRPTLREAVAGRFRRPFSSASANDQLWALKDVTFDVSPGEIVGIIGRNGAGKSTLLKILARIISPTCGSVDIYGRVGSLLELGTGFHPDLTGRENVYLNGVLLGLKQRDIARRFDEIVAFADIERFLDTPVKHYSSGMYLRLAFAVAAHLDAEILLLDEVLAVGDAAFQTKCLDKMREVSRAGRTVLFVSHHMDAVQQLCERVLLIRGGALDEADEPKSMIEKYLADATSGEAADVDVSAHPSRMPRCTPTIRRLSLLTGNGRPTTRFLPDDGMTIDMLIEPIEKIHEPRLAVAIEDQMGRRITTAASYFEQGRLPDIDGPSRFRCTLPPLRLGEGRYLLSVSVANKHHGMIDGLHCAVWFDVVWRNSFGNGETYLSSVYGPVLTRSSWERVE